MAACMRPIAPQKACRSSRGAQAQQQILPQRPRLVTTPTPRRAKPPAPALAAVAAPAPVQGDLSIANNAASGHSTLLHGLGDVGDIPAAYVPWLLRLAHARSKIAGGDSAHAVQEAARGIMMWRCALDRGLLPDDEVARQISKQEAFAQGRTVQELRWPEEPLATLLIRVLAKLGVAHFARKYPGVKDALLRSVLETACAYHRALAGEVEAEQQRERDAYGNLFKTAAELQAEEAAQRAARRSSGQQVPEPQPPTSSPTSSQSPPSGALASGTSAQAQAAGSAAAASQPVAGAAAPADGSVERRLAVELAKELYHKWAAPMDTLSKAGRAFDGLEALLGGAGGDFELSGNIWKRAGWGQMDTLRRRLEDLKELRDLVRSLGRGGGWGPLRRAPIQYLDFNGRPGLLRTVLEAQETRGLTRSDDISRLLPAEAALLARGRTVRQAKLLFYAKLAEKSLQTYERDGWGDFPTNIIPERREVRPTADRGPILLCVDTSGSMRGPRETVAKALALECMRAAKEQERSCYVYAFSGPAEVRELELNMDMKSVHNLLEFLEKVFNGGSDFNEPVKRCLERLTSAQWANSDILLVSDGELRQPGQDIMRKLSGAKDKLGLRVHGLIVGSPEKKKADPAVLRSLCSNILPNGKQEVLVSEFGSWASVQADSSLGAMDWDDKEGNTRRRLVSLQREKARQEESRRLKAEQRAQNGDAGKVVARRPVAKH